MMALNTPNHPDKELLEQYCGWVRQYKELIERLKQFDFISQKVRQYVREHGICVTTGEEVDAMLEEVMKFMIFDITACQYAGQLIDFFYEQAKIVPVGQTWVGSSEIIESLFGKLKSLECDQSKGGFTSLVLGAAACAGKIDATVVMAAMAQVKTADVNAWTNEQIGITLLAKRRKSLGAWRQKKSLENVVHKPAGITHGVAVGF